MAKSGQLGSIIRDVDFPKFTTDLVTGVFEALQANQLTQLDSYSDLLSRTSKTLTQYIDENSNEVHSDDVLALLAQPLASPISLGSGASRKEYASLGEWYSSADSSGALTQVTSKGAKASLVSALGVSTSTDPTTGADIIRKKTEIESIKTQSELVQLSRERIAAQRHGLLTQMVRMGMQRLVITKGEINTRVTFKLSETELDTKDTKDISYKNTSWGAAASYKGKLFGGKLSVSGGIRQTSTKVRTVDETSVDMSSLDIDLFGSVKLEFKTDYFPLAPPSPEAE